MKLDCDVMVSVLFVMCAMISWIVVTKKSRASFIDVERWAFNEKETMASDSDFTIKWYAFRLCSVILVIGGFMHGHRILKRSYTFIFS